MQIPPHLLAPHLTGRSPSGMPAGAVDQSGFAQVLSGLTSGSGQGGGMGALMGMLAPLLGQAGSGAAPLASLASGLAAAGTSVSPAPAGAAGASIGASALAGPGAGQMMSSMLMLSGMSGLDGMFSDGDESGGSDDGMGSGMDTGGSGGDMGIIGLLGMVASMMASATPQAPAMTSESAAGTRTSLAHNVSAVAQVAREKGVPEDVAVAMMLVESGGDNTAVGDGGTSFGLFQLHQGGMLTSAGLSPAQATDPVTNARVSLGSLAQYARGRRGSDWGTIAAASQRPADPVGYAAKVNAALPRARHLLDT